MAWSASSLLGSLADKVSAASKTITGITANLGDLVIVGGQGSSGGNGLTGFTVSDSSANTWTVIQAGTTGGRALLAYCIIAAGKTLSAGTVTVTRTGTTNITWCAFSVVSFTGGVTSSIEDSVARNTASGSGLTPSVTSGTPASAGDLFVAVCGDNFTTAVPTYTESASWTTANSLATTATNGALGAIAYQVNSGTGTLTHNPVLVGLGTHTWGELVTGFFVASSGVTGDAAWTEAQDTWAAAGGPIIDGTAAWTEVQDSWAASGTVAWLGTAAWIEAQDAWAAAGSVIIDGSAAWTETQDNWAAAGSVAQPSINADVSWIEAQDVWNGQGTAGAQGGHFIPLTEKQLRTARKQERHDRKLREDREDAGKIDAATLESEIRANMFPDLKNLSVVGAVFDAETSVEPNNDDEEDLELILLHA